VGGDARGVKFSHAFPANSHHVPPYTQSEQGDTESKKAAKAAGIKEGNPELLKPRLQFDT